MYTVTKKAVDNKSLFTFKKKHVRFIHVVRLYIWFCTVFFAKNSNFLIDYFFQITFLNQLFFANGCQEIYVIIGRI